MHAAVRSARSSRWKVCRTTRSARSSRCPSARSDRSTSGRNRSSARRCRTEMEPNVKCRAFVLIIAFAAATASAQTTDSPLTDLLNTPISTAAKYDQRMGDVAASVTVITAEEIARYGWHTLADMLAAARGLYTSYDRDYTYLGVR